MSRKDHSLARNAAYLGIGLLTAAVAVPATIWKRRNEWIRGKVVVITGASRGLGLAMAEEFGKRGARLVLAARDPFELDRARRTLLSEGAVASERDVLTIPADLREQHQAEEMIKQATDHFGCVDVLINNAGVITVGPVENQTVEQFEDVMASNFYSGLYCTMAVLPQMLERKDGSIANITSIGGKVAVPHLLPYTASKFAAVGFSEGLAVELRSKGVCVTTVVPGLMRTGSHRNAQFAGDASREYRWFSLGASTPGVSIAAASAARKIANAVVAGSAEVTITPQAILISRIESLAPGVVRGMMGGMQMILPAPQPGEHSVRRGEQVRNREWFPATTIGASAAHRYNQI